MATKKKSSTDLLIPKDVTKALDKIAKGAGLAVKELWTIFVRQYLVKGIGEAFTAIVLIVAAFFLWPVIGLFILIPLAAALGLCYGAIMLIGNPRYYALEDVTSRLKAMTSKKTEVVEVSQSSSRPYSTRW